MTDTIIQLTGLTAGSITALSTLPQLLKIIKEKKVEDISIWMLIILITGLGFWTLYGFLKHDIPILITNLFSLLVNFILVGLRIKYKK
ncbi:MAG: SemiSWEET transporter [Bacteroidota bacterium]|nr:SemiSWEET transporter [Bacteroidota bacterium]